MKRFLKSLCKYFKSDLTEIKESRVFRSQQTLALAETKELRIQKIIKEEGMSNLSIVSHQA